MKQLIIRSAELEIEQARESNPLTMLPGNRAIRGWISSALAHGGTVIYADLDYFKEFNDAFGFILGDEAIRLTGRILTEHLDVVAPGARLGHLGGDDFVIVSWAAVSDDALETLCSSFDREKAPLFDEATRVAGCFSAIDRLGQRRSVPLTTLSLAVVPGPRLGIEPHPA